MPIYREDFVPFRETVAILAKTVTDVCDDPIVIYRVVSIYQALLGI